MAAYSAFLISSLAVQHQNLPFRDLQGLLYDGSYRLGVARNNSQINILDVCGILFCNQITGSSRLGVRVQYAKA
jgi:hypothetical protein